MKSVLWLTVVRTVIPPILGGLGALAATMAPAYYKAVCGGFAIIGG